MTNFQPVFVGGDRVRVIKKDTRFTHGWEPGLIATLIAFDPTDNSWRARADGAEIDEWQWVAQEVLEPLVPEASLDKQMAILLGVRHCDTCTCGEADE